MKGKTCAILWNFIHSIGDVIEEKVLLETDEKKYLFGLNFSVLLGLLIMSLFFPMKLTMISCVAIFLYTIAFTGGDYCYAKSIVHVPLGLANLISSGGLFINLICDIILGYVKPNIIFFILFLVFFFSVTAFSAETNKMKKEIQNKKVDLAYIFLLITSTIFYAAEPYFIKLANSLGANESGINIISSLFATIWWGLVYFKTRKKDSKEESQKLGWKIFLLGAIYTITSILYMKAYADGAPVIISLILQLQVFIIVIISVIQKTDKMNAKKILYLILSVLSLVFMALLN